METAFYNIEEQKFWNDTTIWTNGGHEWSGPFGTTEKLWNDHIFEDLKAFRGKNIVEIAPGHGRMTQFLAILANKLTVIDLNPTCIEATQQKLGHHVDKYIVGDGKSLKDIKSNSQHLVFSFDSFVHMHANVTAAYLREIYRVLKPGGTAWIHHSHLYGGEDLSFNNIAGRAAMNPMIFRTFAAQAELEVVSQRDIKFEAVDAWDGIDTISIVKKAL